MGADHPVTWCKDYKGGRSYYTNHGASSAAWNDANLVKELVGAIQWAAGESDPVYSDCGATVLANYQQIKISAPPNLLEPIGFDQFPDGRIIQTARGGSLRLHDPATGTTQVIATDPGLHQQRGRPVRPGGRQRLRHQQVGLPVLLATDRRGREVGSDGTLHTQTTPAGNAPTTAASLSAWDPWVGYFQLSRFKFVDGAAPGASRPGLGAADPARAEQPRRVLPRRRRHRLRRAQQPVARHRRRHAVRRRQLGRLRAFNDMLTNESQTIAVTNATGGTFTLTFNGQTTAPIPFNSTTPRSRRRSKRSATSPTSPSPGPAPANRQLPR